MDTFRIEHDLLGELNVSANVYWGIHTQRALSNFDLSGRKTPLAMVRALACVKKACAVTNGELDYLDDPLVNAIKQACDEIAAGQFDDQFPLDSLQGGAGTSTNMNVNEVIANRALELMGKVRGDYAFCHPIEQVNLHQSTNDVYPTALKIACIRGVRLLSESIAGLQGSLQAKETEFAAILTMGRTELQDAVPITLGAQFSSFAEAIGRDRWRTFKCEERLRVVNIGGTAVGTGITAPRDFIFLVIERLRELSGCPLARSENLLDATANADALVEVSGILSAHASTLIKIADDLRRLHALGEIELSAMQAGSSIMPGKVNPVACEAVIQVGIRANANHGIVAECASRGSFQINEFLPLLGSTLIETIESLTRADRLLNRTVKGLSARAVLCEKRVAQSTTLITALLPLVGYDQAQTAVQEFTSTGRTDFQCFLEERFGRDRVGAALSPASFMALGHTNKL